MDINAFQQLIAERYYKTDSARGTAKTFMWFVEEVGELATALADVKSSQKDKEEEFADIFAWLCTLANINDVNIEKACIEKYIKKKPKGHK
ncbi:MAG: MazG nucleotide pyrophosphohydrolase domain protein [Planctomycetes bacterium ADurb.Bin401]|nr:MAG: MazG nucleotide pyrophosphohydrolase domain protein [Planctomycetes bacterium ADurb.Bin401]